MRPLRMLIDLDEVLVDFLTPSCWLHGVSREEMEAKRVPGQWGAANALGMSQEDFMLRVDKVGETFWYALRWYPWAAKLLFKIRGMTTDWYLTSAGGAHQSAYSGKVMWIKSRFGQDFDRFVLTPHKHLMANLDTVLIDDKQTHIDEFIENGGQGVLFPNQGNRLYEMASDPLPYVFRELDRIKEQYDARLSNQC